MEPKKKADPKSRRQSAMPGVVDPKKIADIAAQKVKESTNRVERLTSDQYVTCASEQCEGPQFCKQQRLIEQSGSEKQLNQSYSGPPAAGLSLSTSTLSLRKQNESASVSAPGNVKVICRFRPMNQRELDHPNQYEMIVYDKDKKTVGFKKTEEAEQPTHKFTFDRTFPSESQQVDVYDSVKDIIQGLFDGFNGTIFAYGQTGSGKTHTMMGPDEITPETAGLIPRITSLIFDTISNTLENIEFLIKVSMVEIYMEKIKDLLCPRNDNLKIHQDKEKGVYISDVTELYVSDESEVSTIMMRGNENRAVSSTNMNQRSSRSHTIFIINIKQTNKDDQTCKSGKLYLVDLAGSEKISKTGATGHVLDEAITINKSLTTLGIVINKLTDGVSKFIPYRDSKLTRVLQESLGGNAKTCLIITCSPSSFNSSETLSTLRFGFRAKSIKNKPKVNKEYTVAELKMLLAKAEQRIEGLIKRNMLLEKIIRDMGGDVPAIYDANQDLLGEGEENEIDGPMLDQSNSEMIGNLSEILPDPLGETNQEILYTEPDGVEELDQEEETEDVKREEETEELSLEEKDSLNIRKKWKHRGSEIQEVEGEEEEIEEPVPQAKLQKEEEGEMEVTEKQEGEERLEKAEAGEETEGVEGAEEAEAVGGVEDGEDMNEEDETSDVDESVILQERLKVWEKRCNFFQKELQKTKLEKEKEVGKLIERVAKERERAQKYRKKIEETQREASKKGATLMLVTSENQNLVKKIALLNLQTQQNDKYNESRDNRMKQLSEANNTLLKENALLKESVPIQNPKLMSPASPSSGPFEGNQRVLEVLKSVVQEVLLPKHLESSVRELVGKEAIITVGSEELSTGALTKLEAKLMASEAMLKSERNDRLKERDSLIRKYKRKEERIKEKDSELKMKDIQIQELKGALERNGNPLQDKLETLEKNLEHLTMLYYQLVSQKSTLQLEKNILEKKIKRLEKQLHERNVEYRSMRDLAEHRKLKLEKVLRKLNRGLEDQDPFLSMATDEYSRESVIGDDVVKSGKIAKPIKGGSNRNKRSTTEYVGADKKGILFGSDNKIHPR